MKDHATLAQEFIADEARTDWHNETLWFVRQKRDKAAQNLPEWEQLRDWASQIKDHTLSQLHQYLIEFENNATANGITVHWAANAEEHNQIIYSIIEQNNIKLWWRKNTMG